MPDQLLLFLHAFFQASGIRGNFKGCRLIERDEFRFCLLVCACADTAVAQIASQMTAARRVGVIILVLKAPRGTKFLK
jgi:hypothetical protein